MNNLKVFGLILLSILAAMVGVYGIGRKSGKKAVELQQTNRTLKVIKESQHVKNDIDSSDIDDVRVRLRNGWTRD